MEGPVRVRYTKWGGTLHWHFTANRLDEDEHGVWLGAPAGTPVRRGSEPAIVSGAFVLLIPRDRWWTVVWNTEDSPFRYRVYADVCTPAVWEEGVVSAVDLDLDVVTDPAGSVSIRDEDEFSDHAHRWGYPLDVTTAARTAADDLAARMRTGIAPFDGSERPRLLRARRLS